MSKNRTEMPWVIPEKGRPEIYSNHFHLHWTRVDVRIRFGMVIPNPTAAPSEATKEIQEVAAAVMSWDQAKYLRDSLAEVVRLYEEVNDEIKPKKLPKATEQPG